MCISINGLPRVFFFVHLYWLCFWILSQHRYLFALLCIYFRVSFMYGLNHLLILLKWLLPWPFSTMPHMWIQFIRLCFLPFFFVLRSMQRRILSFKQQLLYVFWPQLPELWFFILLLVYFRLLLDKLYLLLMFYDIYWVYHVQYNIMFDLLDWFLPSFRVVPAMFRCQLLNLQFNHQFMSIMQQWILY